MSSRSVSLAVRIFTVALVGATLATSGFQLAGRLVASNHRPSGHTVALSQWKGSSGDVNLTLSGGGYHPQPSPTPTAAPPKPTPPPAAGSTPTVRTPAASAPNPPQFRPAPPPPPRPAPPPPPPLVIGSTQQALINSDRAGAGLRPLNWSSCLAGIAAQQARAMAAAHTIFHGNGVNEDWGCHLGSVQTGENVGVWGGGINDSAINQLFMNSAPHRANIMGPYHWVGTAWVVGSNGAGYIAVEFA